jgi:sulfite reductase alpha subunit-like flavoprotein
MNWTTIADDTIIIKSATGTTFSYLPSMSPNLRYLDDALPHNIPRSSTLRKLFTGYLDFSCVPRRSFFEALRHFAQDEMEREKLDEFLSDDGAVRINLSLNRAPDPLMSLG